MDSLSQLLEDLDFNAEVFFSGSLCGVQAFEKEERAGTLHFLRSGTLTLTTEQDHEIILKESAVIFIPDGNSHRMRIKEPQNADLVCASIHFQPNQKAVLVEKLPKFICIGMNDDTSITQTADWIFNEAFNEKEGKQTIINRLCDVIMVQLLRYIIDKGIVEQGLFAATAHPRLSKLMAELQKHPAKEWSVDAMAEMSAMSRSKFAALFKETVGRSPMDYVTDLRLAMAQGLLKKNKPVGFVANEVGYESASTLARIYKKRFGITPKQWIKEKLGS